MCRQSLLCVGSCYPKLVRAGACSPWQHPVVLEFKCRIAQNRAKGRIMAPLCAVQLRLHGAQQELPLFSNT